MAESPGAGVHSSLVGCCRHRLEQAGQRGCRADGCEAQLAVAPTDGLFHERCGPNREDGCN